MSRARSVREPDLLADPFGERATPCSRRSLELLGGRFVFESNSERLLRLVDHACGGLPAHREPAAGKMRIHLHEVSAAAVSGLRREPAALDLFSGAGLVGGVMDCSGCMVVSAAQRSAMVVVGPRVARFDYHVRYELIEFATYALASRVLGLVPLHAACVGRNGRGVLLMGPSGSGKSTVTLQCWLEGFDFLAEDSVLVRPDSLEATGLASFLHAGADSLRWVPPHWATRIRRSPVIRRRSGVRKFEFDLRRGGGCLAVPPLQIQSLVFLDRRPGRQGALLSALAKREAQARLRENQAYAVGQPGWNEFARTIGRLPAFELRRGAHPLQAVEALGTLI